MKLRDWLEKTEMELRPGDELTFVDIANFKRRNYAHFRDEAASCRVRPEEKQNARKQQKTLSRPLRYYIRGLLNEDPQVIGLFVAEYPQMIREDYLFLIGIKDQETLEALPPQHSFYLSQIVRYMSRAEVIKRLGLSKVVATKLLGYEKEIFWLHCLGSYVQPGVVLRVGVRILGNGAGIPEQDPIELHDLI